MARIVLFKSFKWSETDLKQVFRPEGYRRDLRKCLKNMVGRAGVEPVAR
jgi:hypothetical protein